MASEYKGPGKILSTLGGWFIGGLVGGLVGAGAGILLLPFGLVAATTCAAIFGLAGHIIGAVKGYERAVNGQRQFEEAQTVAIQAVGARGQSIGNLQSQELETGTRFTDRVPSRATEGNYADAVLADRANAAGAMQTR